MSNRYSYLLSIYLINICCLFFLLLLLPITQLKLLQVLIAGKHLNNVNNEGVQ